MNEPQQPKKRNWRNVFLISILITSLIIAALTFVKLGLHYPGPRYLYYGSVEEIIRQGDRAFEVYDYDAALARYRAAERKLSEMIEFESNSPSKSMSLLQHYYNIKALLKARTELSQIAVEILRLEPPLKNHHPTTRN